MVSNFFEFYPGPEDLLPQASVVYRYRNVIDDAMDMLAQVIGAIVLLVVYLVIFLPLLTGSSYFNLDYWSLLVELINPYFFAAMGLGIVIGFSTIGAGWGIYISGASIMGAGIRLPKILSKHFISVIFCEAVAIYGIIMAIIISTKYSFFAVTANNITTYTHPSIAYFAGYTLFAGALIVGLGNLSCAASVGILGSCCAIADAANQTLFVKVLVIEIFASAIGIFSVIVGIVLVAQASFIPS